jgi:hypothetical protein
VTDYAPDPQAPTAGAAGTLRTATASADTVAAGCLMLVNNTGVGAHNVDLGVNYSYDGLNPGSVATGPGKRRFTIPAGTWMWIRVRADAGDANGRCSVTVDATASEVKYFTIGE